MFALATPMLIGAVGLAVDYANAVSVRSSLRAAAEAAVLAGAKKGSEASSRGDKDWEKQAKDEATAFFHANILTSQVKDVDFDPSFSLKGATVSGAAKFTYKVDTYFMSIFGDEDTTVGGAPKASVSAANYIDIAFLIDNSASMGIGATAADQQAIFNKTVNAYGTRCAFACHLPKNDWEMPFTVANAHSAINASTGKPAQLRIDVVREAALNALDSLEKRKIADDQVRISVYTFSNTIMPLVEQSTDIKDVRKKIATIDLVKYVSGGPANLGGTYVRNALMKLSQELPAAGTGKSKNSRQSFVVLLSDGIEDSTSNVRSGAKLPDGQDDFNQDPARLANWKSRAGSYWTVASEAQAFDPATCDLLKNQKRTLFAAQIRYITGIGFDDPAQWWNPPIVAYIQKKQGVLDASFTSCVSKPDYRVLASEASEIEPAFKTIIDQILDAAGLTVTN